MGGFTQVGAHGTGAKIPPVDETVVGMKLVTPARGVLALSNRRTELFKLAKCGIGALGAVAELTIQCVDAHKLVEYVDRDANGDRDESRKVDSRVSTPSLHVDSAATPSSSSQ